MRARFVSASVVLLLALSACAPMVSSSGSTKGGYNRPAPTVKESPAEGATVKVGMLIPLSGPQEALGQSLLEAAQLALLDVGDTGFALLPQDTEGTAEGAAKAASRALADGAQMMIGPVFSPEVSAVKPVLASTPVRMLSLSNNELLADSQTYILGLSPDDQVARVLEQAKKAGVSRIAALLPNTPYGDALARAFAAETTRQGLTAVRADRYVAGGDAATTARDFMTGLTAAGGAQALLLGETGPGLIALAPQLAANGFDPAVTKPLGTALWEDGTALHLPALAGAWYAAPAGAQRSAFVARFAAAYGHTPPIIASLAYDTTAMAAVLARSPEKYDVARLTDPHGYSGIDGIFRLYAEGQCERGLAVFEVTAQGNKVLEAAPVSFTP